MEEGGALERGNSRAGEERSRGRAWAGEGRAQNQERN